MTKDEALKLALEALENTTPTGLNMERDKQFFAAITAIKQALALDKKAENARELGLDYEPVQERNFCERCGKRLGDYIHTCTPPAQRTSNNTQSGYEHTQKGNS